MITIREHNNQSVGRWGRKADYIVGVTLDGGFLCADCVGNTPAYGKPGPYGPNPVFSSDDYVGMLCESCLVEAN
jgi:hypothetical protein